MAKKSTRIKIGLECSICKSQNFVTEKNKTNDQDPLALSKFCKRCKKHTEHKEKKKLG
jgi:large subunit ribosomal protein L33